MSDDLKSSTQSAVRALAPFLSPALQSALALVDKSLDVRPSAVVEARLRELVESWRLELRRRLEDAYHPQFLDAQSFTQLVILTVEATIRERLAEKRQMYGRLLARADTAAWGNKKIGRVEEALDALVRLSEGDLRVFRLFAAHTAWALESGEANEEEYLPVATITIRDLKAHLSDLSGLGIKTYILRLERLGLLLPSEVDTTVEDGSYIPTHLLEELIHLAGSPDPPRDIRDQRHRPQ